MRVSKPGCRISRTGLGLAKNEIPRALYAAQGTDCHFLVGQCRVDVGAGSVDDWRWWNEICMCRCISKCLFCIWNGSKIVEEFLISGNSL